MINALCGLALMLLSGVFWLMLRFDAWEQTMRDSEEEK